MTDGFEPVAVADATVDEETDVLVVGFGCAGAAVALEAVAAGSRVTVLERASGPGGSTALSGGEIYLGGGTALQRDCGFDDDAQSMFDFLVHALGPGCDEAKLRAYCEGSAEHFDWLVAQGVPFRASHFDRPGWTPPTEDGLMWLGENAWPYDTLARAVPRGHRPAQPGSGGGLLMARLARACDEAGVESRFDTRVLGLVVDGDRVVGVRARTYGRDRVLLARGGVALTTGGFVDNEWMLAAHAPALVGHGKVSDGYDDGSGILMAQAVGAATRRMATHQLALSVIPGLACRGMLVDGRGQRFLNEDVYPGLLSQRAAQQPGPIWLLVDEQALDETPAVDQRAVRPQFAAETLDELELEIGLPPGALVRTVDEYNAHAAHGLDPLFHKHEKWMRPLAPPFAVIDPRLGFDSRRGRPDGTGFAGFTLGGLATDLEGSVQGVDGRPIPGLYAAGRATAGVHGLGYVSGTSIGDATFFGRAAGRAIGSSA